MSISALPPLDRALPLGIGWRAGHEQALFEQRPQLAFIEVHSENFFAEGGASLSTLLRARADYPVSLHGVGLGLGSAVGLDPWHLQQLAALVDRVQPVRVSDHACFARAASLPGAAVWHASDLLPLAFNEATLAIMVRHLQQTQDRLRRPVLVENLASYLVCSESSLDEPDFFRELTRRSGCGLLLDVNNLVVNALNSGAADPLRSACDWIDRIDPACVGEIHLAGCSPAGPGALLVDDHGAPVSETVWAVYRHALRRCGALPSLVEWDTRLPAFERLLAEAERAGHWMRVEQAAAEAPHAGA